MRRQNLVFMRVPGPSHAFALSHSYRFGLVLLTLQTRSLNAWKDLEEALPARFERARAAVIQRFLPKAQAVTLPKRTVANEAELEEWWLEARSQVLAALQNGPVIL